MVHQGQRPKHRRGTTGRPWRRFRKSQVAGVTNCEKCGKPLIRDAPCLHPNHQRIGYCPTYHAYPTLEHPHKLIDGGAKRSSANALVYCYECNSRNGRRKVSKTKQETQPSRRW